MAKKFSTYIFVFSLSGLCAQLPNTDLWLFKIEQNKEGRTFTKAANITNREGYDNQPSFSKDGKKIYYVSVRDDKQADIYFHDLKSAKNIQLTKTNISEYSPEETPDGKFISAVVVEQDSTQCIRFINRESGVHEKRFEYDSVGYYHFLNNDTNVYYKLTEPHSLRYHTPNEDHWLGNMPIRTFKAVNRYTLVYGLKDSIKVSFYKYNFLLHKGEKYCEFPSLNEDVVWQPSYGLIKSEGSKLLNYNEQKKEWILFADLSAHGIKKITRFVFDSANKYLVVVDNL